MKPLLLLVTLPFTVPNCFCAANDAELLLLLAAAAADAYAAHDTVDAKADVAAFIPCVAVI